MIYFYHKRDFTRTYKLFYGGVSTSKERGDGKPFFDSLNADCVYFYEKVSNSFNKKQPLKESDIINDFI